MKFKSTKQFVGYLFENEQNDASAFSALDAKKFFKTRERYLKSYLESVFRADKKAFNAITRVLEKINNFINEKTKDLPESASNNKREITTGTFDFLTKEKDLQDSMQLEKGEREVFQSILYYLQNMSVIGINSPQPFSGEGSELDGDEGERETMRPVRPVVKGKALTGPMRGYLGSEDVPGFLQHLVFESKFDLNRWQRLAGIKVLKG